MVGVPGLPGVGAEGSRTGPGGEHAAAGVGHVQRGGGSGGGWGGAA